MNLLRRRRRTAHKRDDLLCHELDGEALLYDQGENVTCRLNDTAYFIWQSCDGLHSPEDIARMVAERFEVDRTTAEHDVPHAIRLLAKSGMVRMIRPGASH